MNSHRRNQLVTVLGGAALIGVALHFWGPQKSQIAETAPATESLPTTAAPSPATTANNITATNTQPTPVPNQPLPLLGPHLRKIGDCLHISNSLNDDANLTVTSLLDSVRSELGEVVANQTDWQNVHITLPNGEKRRLRIEVEATSEEGSARRLRYYGVDKEDLPVPIPLTKEQSINPSQEYISSIENQGKVTLREEARRGLFSKGAEIYYTERNGYLSEIEISVNGKSVKCQDLQSNRGNCGCF